MSGVTVPTKANVGIPSDAVFAADQPVAAHQHRALAQSTGNLYEAVYDERFPGAASGSQTQAGHAHTGGGNGAAIPRMLVSHMIAAPAYSASATPALFDWPNNPGAMKVAARPAESDFATTGGDYAAFAFYRFRVRAGATGVAVRIAASVDATGGSATWKTELYDDSWTRISYAEKTESADVDALAWTDLPNATQEATDGVDTYGAAHPVNPNAGVSDRLTADADYILVVACKYTSNAVSRLWGVTAYEVV